SPSDKIAQASNVSFDAATFEIWGALLNGAQLVGISKDVTLSPHEFALQLREKSISVLFLTTALFQQIVRDVPQAFATLKYLLFGGETVNTRWIKKILKHG
ncbi:MAG: AMP-binding protein, partial [Nostoc sp.]